MSIEIKIPTATHARNEWLVVAAPESIKLFFTFIFVSDITGSLSDVFVTAFGDTVGDTSFDECTV